MDPIVYVPLVLASIVVPVARLVVCRVRPDVAARSITIGAVSAAALATWGLALLAAPKAGEELGVGRAAHWSAARVAQGNLVPEAISLLAGLALLVGVARFVQFTIRERRLAVFLRRRCSSLAPGSGLAVLDDPRPDAFAVPGRPGRVVMTTALIRALDATERRVVLAHEHAHLRHRHHRYRAAMEMAAALNPLVSPARRDVAFALERWADEEAAAVVADRTVAAQALAHAALLADESETVDGVLALSRLAVADRVLALNGEPPARRTLLAVGAFLVVVIPAACAAVDATVSLLRLLLAAEGVGGP